MEKKSAAIDEEHLVSQLKKGAPEALKTLVSTYGSRLLKSSYLLCGNEADAEDLVQETFLQALPAVKRFKGKSTLYTWLYAILTNLNRQRRRKRNPVTLPETPLDSYPTEPLDWENQLDMQKAASSLHKNLQSLSLHHKEVLVLRYFEGLKIKEIATVLGISKGTVKSRIHYAAACLKRKIPGELNLFRDKITKERENK